MYALYRYMLGMMVCSYFIHVWFVQFEYLSTEKKLLLLHSCLKLNLWWPNTGEIIVQWITTTFMSFKFQYTQDYRFIISNKWIFKSWNLSYHKYGYNYMAIHFLQFTGIGNISYIMQLMISWECVILLLQYTMLDSIQFIHFPPATPYSFISFHFLNYESTPRYRAVTYYYFMNFVKLPIHSMALYRVTSKYSKVISNVISYSCLWKSYTLNY